MTTHDASLPPKPPIRRAGKRPRRRPPAGTTASRLHNWQRNHAGRQHRPQRRRHSGSRRSRVSRLIRRTSGPLRLRRHLRPAIHRRRKRLRQDVLDGQGWAVTSPGGDFALQLQLGSSTWPTRESPRTPRARLALHQKPMKWASTATAGARKPARSYCMTLGARGLKAALDELEYCRRRARHRLGESARGQQPWSRWISRCGASATKWTARGRWAT